MAVVTPGFVDSHTHLSLNGREDEFKMRLDGKVMRISPLLVVV